MTEQNLSEFARLLSLMGEILGKEVTITQIEAYFRVLKGFTIEQVNSAVEQAIATKKFFPKPSEILELIEGGADDKAEAAWRTVCDLVKFEGEYLSLHVTDGGMAFAIECWGGWVATCAKLGEASPEMVASYAKEFKNSYRLGRTRETGTRYFVGAYEVNNSGLGQWKTMTVDQPVMLVETHESRKLIMQLDLATGRLTGESLAALATGAGLGKFLPPAGEPPKEISAAQCDEEMATPEQVAQLKARISALVPHNAATGVL